MAGYVSSFATGAAIEAVLNKANNSQSVSIAEKTAWNNKQNALTFDTTPTAESSNPVTSDGIYNYIEFKIQYATTDILWSNSNGATVGTEYTMDGNINDYDLVCVKIGTPKDIQQSNLYTQLTFAVAGYTSGERISWEGFLRRYCHMSFSGDKFTLVASDAENENSGYKPTVYEIIGIKFGTGTSNNTSTSIKTLTYTGDGLATTTITFPETPTVILSIDGPGTGTGMVNLASFRYGANAVSGSWSDNDSGSTGDIALRADYSGDTLLLTKGQNTGARCNVNGATYTVTYI